MKTCPFCAEEIQDAAIVCKHCGRDLSQQPTARSRRSAKIALIIVGVIIVVIGACYFSPEHQAFLDFDARRTAWHERCDERQRLGRNADPEAYDACAKELHELIAEGKAHGWD